MTDTIITAFDVRREIVPMHLITYPLDVWEECGEGLHPGRNFYLSADHIERALTMSHPDGFGKEVVRHLKTHREKIGAGQKAELHCDITGNEDGFINFRYVSK